MGPAPLPICELSRHVLWIRRSYWDERFTTMRFQVVEQEKKASRRRKISTRANDTHHGLFVLQRPVAEPGCCRRWRIRPRHGISSSLRVSRLEDKMPAVTPLQSTTFLILSVFSSVVALLRFACVFSSGCGPTPPPFPESCLSFVPTAPPTVVIMNCCCPLCSCNPRFSVVYGSERRTMM